MIYNLSYRLYSIINFIVINLFYFVLFDKFWFLGEVLSPTLTNMCTVHTVMTGKYGFLTFTNYFGFDTNIFIRDAI